MKTINLISGNVYHELNTQTSHAVYNMYINDLDQLKIFWGYEETSNNSLSPSQYHSRFITGNGQNLLIADNNGILVLEYNPNTKEFDRVTEKLLFEDARSDNYAPQLPRKPKNDGYSFIQDEKGIIYVTDGSYGGLYLLWIPYDDDKKAIPTQIYFQQFPYNKFDTSPDSAVYTSLVSGGKITALINPVQVEYLDTHIICVDDATGYMHVIDNVLLSGKPENPFNFDGVGSTQPKTTVTYGFSIQSSPCPITAVKRINSTLYVIGTKVTELWLSSTGLIPIQRYRDRSFEFGTNLRKTILNFNGKLLMLASSPDKMWGIYIWDATKSQATFVTKDNINYTFLNVPDFSKITFTAFGMHSKEFLIVNFNEPNPDEHYSLLIDVDTQDSFYLVDEYLNKPSRFLADDIFRFKDEYYFISWNINKLYRFSEQIKTYNGKPINCSIRTQRFYSQNNQRLELSNLQIAFAPLEAQYYSYFDKNCIPILQDNQETGYKISHKDRTGIWVEEKVFRRVNRQSFHTEKRNSITSGYNVQTMINFYQSTYLELGEYVYLPIILNNISIDVNEIS